MCDLWHAAPSQVVEPKRQKLAESEATLGEVMKALRLKQAELQEVMDKLAALDADLTVRAGGAQCRGKIIAEGSAWAEMRVQSLDQQESTSNVHQGEGPKVWGRKKTRGVRALPSKASGAGGC